jgi:hypothetical protein
LAEPVIIEAVIEIAASTQNDRVGLCAECSHMRRITSDRGANFYMCTLSAVNPDFPKYPRLPVIQCSGFEKAMNAPKLS